MVKRLFFKTQKEGDSYLVNQRQKGHYASDLADELGISDVTVRRVYACYRETRRVRRRIGSRRRKVLNSLQAYIEAFYSTMRQNTT